MDYAPGPIAAVDPSQIFRARDYTDVFASLVAQAALDVGGASGAIDAAHGRIAPLAGVDVYHGLAGHEADLVASQAADRASLANLALTSEVDATDALDPAISDGLRAAGDAAAAHAALSGQIDAGAAAVPVPPDGHAPPTPPDTSDWPTPPG